MLVGPLGSAATMRSMHIIGSRYSGGAERFYTRLVLGLAEKGQAVLPVNRPGSMVAAELGPAVRQAHVPMRNAFDLLSRWQIARLVEKHQPDIVQTYMGRATGLTHLPKGTSAVHIARLGGFYKLKRYRHADAWIGNTEAICDYLKENGFPERRVFYIRNFVERPEPASPPQLQALREQYAIPSDALIIVSAGRFVAKKGFPDLLAAFSRLPDEIHDRPLHLIVVGDGPLAEELGTFAVRAGIAQRVHWTGWQTDPGFFYELADVFVCPSRHEPLGNVILEAWSHGAAVVATATHGARALITDGVDGVLIREEDPAALGEAIGALLRQDPRTRAALGCNGQQTVMGHYGGEAVLNEYLNLYRMLTSRS